MRRVGIMGGMGPEATIALMERVVKLVNASDDADHIPLIVDQNTQVPSRIAHLIDGDGPDPTSVLIEMARRLEDAGAEALAIACNTAHHYRRAIAGGVSVPLLSAVELAAERVTGRGKVGILGSPALQQVALFDEAFQSLGAQAVYPTHQAPLLAAIKDIKANGPNMASEQVLAEAAFDLLREGAGAFVIACTEFSLVPVKSPEGIEVFDVMDILAEAIVAFAQGEAQ
ncbi:MAG: amino acid racemase [Pseudomonadota bacterium]